MYDWKKFSLNFSCFLLPLHKMETSVVLFRPQLVSHIYNCHLSVTKYCHTTQSLLFALILDIKMRQLQTIKI